MRKHAFAGQNTQQMGILYSSVLKWHKEIENQVIEDYYYSNLLVQKTSYFKTSFWQVARQFALISRL